MSKTSEVGMNVTIDGPPIKHVSHGRAVLVLATGTAFLAGTPL